MLTSRRSVLFLGSREKPFKLGRQTIVFSSPTSKYFADSIAAELQVARGNIEYGTRHGCETYYRLDIPDPHYLVGKDVVYVGSLVSDADFLDILRIGVSLAAYVVK
eukprot:TRINITY_DN2140_c0_g1_i2.p1 TRINITY_DN2140_c0_g1~~TRINITY_DN2140_c0_g1_i2.p1  ORF type:complete len:106 (-),score=7.66 TRINITY_DN2140_c0_g1_i2:819-1136(-)